MGLASTWLDIVVGVDLHIEVVPTPAPTPTPFPHPHCSVIFDPIGYVVGEVTGALFAMAMGQPALPGGPVLIGGRMSTVTGDAASMPIKHIIIPPGTTFVKGITPSDAELLVGSKTVLVRGSNAVRAADVALSCSEPVRLPTAAVVPTSGGPSVTMIGGPPAIDFGAAIGMLGMGALRNKWTAKKLHSAVDAVIPDSWPRLRRLAHKSACFFTGHPVNVSSGTVSTSAVDLELPGPIPLRFERDYDSNWCDRDGAIGHGWSHTFDQSVWIEAGCVVVQGGDGRELEFRTTGLTGGVMRKGDRVWHAVDRCTLVSKGELVWEIEDADGNVRVFAPIAGESPVERDRGRSRLVGIRDGSGHAIALHYDERARLVRIVDSAGRTIALENDAMGRLRRLFVPAADGRGLRQHAEYRYDAAGDLVGVVDACGKAWTFEYDEHLLVRERDREGLSFYFVYDGRDRYARCVRTWGDGGIYDHVIDYDRRGLATVVTNSLGEITTYQMNGLGMVTAIVQPDGTTVTREYTPATWLAAETDEIGATTRYHYDERGNRVMIALPATDAGPRVTKIRYDAKDRPIELVDPLGATWTWQYDSAGRVMARADPLRHSTTYVWEGGVLAAVVDAAGARTSLGWDSAHNLVSITAADGSVAKRAYDAMGRVVVLVDAKGNTQRRQYDAAGRITRVEEPDGNAREIVRDGEGRVVRARDRLRDVTLGYAGMGWLASRSVGGTTVCWRHDTEGQVIAVVDERGQEHAFERDVLGRVHVERAIGGVETRFARDAIGRVIEEHRAGGVVVTHAYDAAGARTETVYPQGGTERFVYDRAGRLVSATNDDLALVLDRDPLGRVIRETSTRTDTALGDRKQVVVERKLDHRGRRVGLSSSLGADVTLERNVMGDVLRVTQGGGAMKGWEATFGRDALGDEIDRVLPGGARSYWWRDAQGRPTQHMVGRGDTVHRLRAYRWGVDDRLLGITEQGGEQSFEHDARGMLVRGVIGESTVDGRFPDELGRIFAAATQSDREYGSGGELRKRRTASGTVVYEHDGEGRLATKIEESGATWRYHWNDAGRLVQVDRPDGTAVALTYDALGRRVSKRSGGAQTCFVADGQVVLHEWREAAEVPVPRPVLGEDARRAALMEIRGELERVLPADLVAPRWEQQLAAAERGFPRLVAELRGGAKLDAGDVAGKVITWLFEPGSYAPLARITGEDAHAIVADHVGTPLVVLDAAGDAKAQLATDSWGRAQVSGDARLVPWRFAGQYRDDETGLSYNRFRYYDPDAGQYISRDPIGLRGGLRAYGYVEDPGVGCDPLGLSPQPGAGCATATDVNEPAGIIYLRTDVTGGQKPYVGQAESKKRFYERQREHGRANPDAAYEFEIVGRGEAGPELNKIEEDWIRAGGGPTNKSNPEGGLENKRHQMREERYRDSGGEL